MSLGSGRHRKDSAPDCWRELQQVQDIGELGRGSGLKRISKECVANGVRVGFKVLKSGFLVTFHRSPAAGVPHSTVGKTVGKTWENIIALLRRNPKATRAEIANSIGLSVRGVEWNLSALKKRGMLKRVGSAKGGHWKVVK